MRKILHVDMDAFYVSIEIRDRPDLKDFPVAVGGSAHHRGIICTANYRARAFGVRSAMATAYAVKICPDLIVLPVNMEKYTQVAQELRKIFSDYTPYVEPVSLDEAYLDITDCPHLHGSGKWIGEEIRQRIQDTLSLTASVGVSFNKFLAKLASEHHKPDGLFVLEPAQALSFLADLPVKNINGVGRVTQKKLADMGILSCSDLQKASLSDLVNHFGVWGKKLHDLSFGKDDRPVEWNRIRKSLSVEETFSQDIPLTLLDEKILSLYHKLEKRLSHKGDEKIKAQFVKIKFYDFKIITREKSSRSLSLTVFKDLFEAGFSFRKDPVRLLGMGVDFMTHEDHPSKNQLSFDF